jgi:hypothetical protein
MTISKPVWSENVGIYNFAWDELNVYAKVDRIYSKDKSLVGELKLWRNIGDSCSILELLKLDLLSDKSRNTLSEALKRINKDIDWLNILKYICFITVENYRKGEKIEWLGDEPPTMSQEFLLYPILRKGQPMTIFADGGTGKSYLGDYFAVCVYYARPGFYIPYLGTLSPIPVNVLMLDWEAEKIDHQRRVWAIKKGMGIESDTDRFCYRRCNQPLVDDIYAIQQIVKEYNIGLTIIDSQVAASDDSRDPADGARRYYNALRSINCTTITLDHVPKGNGVTDTHKPYGSTFKWNLSRSQFELKKLQKAGENVIQLALYHRKNNEGLLLKPIGYQVEFMNLENGVDLDKVIFTGIDVPDELSNGETVDLTQRIKKVVMVAQNGKMNVENIANVLKLNKAEVQTYLENHRDTFGVVNNLWYVVAQKLDQ